VSVSTVPGMILDMASATSSGAFWNNRRAIVQATFNDRAFKDDPLNESAVLLGDKLGYVIVGSSVDPVPIKNATGVHLFTLSAVDPEHRRIAKTVHLTVVVTRGLDYRARAPDGSLELPLSDPRILCYSTRLIDIEWRVPQ